MSDLQDLFDIYSSEALKNLEDRATILLADRQEEGLVTYVARNYYHRLLSYVNERRTYDGV